MLEEEDEDDVDCLGSGSSNGRNGVGGCQQLDPIAKVTVLQRKDKRHDGVGGPKLDREGRHLMLVKNGEVSRGKPEIFESDESFVEDSVGLPVSEGANLGLGEKENNGPEENGLLQKGAAVPLVNLSAHESGPVGQESPKIRLQRCLDQAQVQEIGLLEYPCMQRSIIPLEVLSSGGIRGEHPKSTEVSSSHLPCINLLVDLNDAACRKRRRRQLSNLLLIQEEMEREDRSRSCSSSSSGETLQSTSLIEREVRATMAVGAELGIQYVPADEQFLRRMIEEEDEECVRSQARDGEA